MRRFILGSLLTCTMLLAATETANAQIFGIGRGRRGGSSIWVDTPYFSYGQGYGSRGWYGNRYDNWYGSRYGDNWYGNRGYYNRNYYVEIGTPWYSSYTPSYLRSYSPSYYYGTPNYYSSGIYSPYGSGVEYSRSMYTPAASDNDKATIEVVVPAASARVWFNDHQTQQSGVQRMFISPTLESGKEYSYNVRASWMDNGREMTATKEVSVVPGRSSLVVFNPGDGADTSRIPVKPIEKDAVPMDRPKDDLPKERNELPKERRELPPQ